MEKWSAFVDLPRNKGKRKYGIQLFWLVGAAACCIIAHLADND